MEIPSGTGSGFVWDDRGHVVTNFHVIESAVKSRGKVRVTLPDGTTWEAFVVGFAPEHDLAVLKVDAHEDRFEPIPVGTSRDLEVGQKVFAIGNPFGLDRTLTTGVISGLGREIKSRSQRKIQNVIQSDAAINPGNSGGPLLDSAGRLIGVNTAIISPSGAYAGIGFAIPVDTVNRVVPELLQHGRVIHPGLGVRIADRIAEQFGQKGVLILFVEPDSAAAEAGMRSTVVDEEGNIQLGDILIEIDGQEVASADDLFAILQEHSVGDTVTVKIVRNARTENEETLELPVTLQAVR